MSIGSYDHVAEMEVIQGLSNMNFPQRSSWPKPPLSTQSARNRSQHGSNPRLVLLNYFHHEIWIFLHWNRQSGCRFAFSACNMKKVFAEVVYNHRTNYWIELLWLKNVSLFHYEDNVYFTCVYIYSIYIIVNILIFSHFHYEVKDVSALW